MVINKIPYLFRRDNEGRARGIGKVCHQWVNCIFPGCSYQAHASCLFAAKEFHKEIKRKKELEEMMFSCVNHR